MNRAHSHSTGILQMFGIRSYRSWILPFPAWFIGFVFTIYPLIFPAFFYIDIFEFQGET